MRAVIYVRFSTAEQTENLSLATQERLCREFCAREGFDAMYARTCAAAVISKPLCRARAA